MKKYFSLMLLAGAFLFFQPGVVRADDLGDLSSRMSKIEANQEKILQSLEDIKNELQIVKVRVTSR